MSAFEGIRLVGKSVGNALVNAQSTELLFASVCSRAGYLGDKLGEIGDSEM